MRRAARGFALALLLTTAAACGSSTDPLNDLSEAEAALVLSALSSVWFPSPSVPSSAPMLAPETTVRTDTTAAVVPCPAGGSASVATIDSTTTTIDSRINPTPDTLWAANTEYSGESTTTVSYADCQSSDGQGNVWTFDADPGLSFAYDFDGTLDTWSVTGQASVVNSVLDWNGVWSGSFGWTNGGRSGTCSISLTISSATSNLNGQVTTTFSQQGQMCGLDVSNSG